MCDWTNLEQIMQDLTLAQRCEVPAPLETFNVEPPVFNIEEESAEQSYYASQGGGGGDFVAPDFELIQEMLSMVKEKKDERKGDDPTDSRDLDPHSREFVPQRIHKKINRNVALTSIITANEAELSPRRPIPIDVIPTMFKKKSLNHISHHNTEETSKNASPSQTLSPQQCKQYTPSTHANEYYTKYLQKSKIKEEFAQDIWARAERQMKALEVRKKQKAEIVSPKESDKTSPLGIACAFFDVNMPEHRHLMPSTSFDVNLPEHRHLMPGDCIVCIVAAKHGYYI